ncbi:MAG: hypothetical protein IT422_23955 [Pirellulaceae bacterium]|jgi:hypothetical protein|nr:hypothetical protein [Planctomycetales bacterium]MCC7338158.1 hypothetical protein [Pirellulaceae bacterium]
MNRTLITIAARGAYLSIVLLTVGCQRDAAKPSAESNHGEVAAVTIVAE